MKVPEKGQLVYVGVVDFRLENRPLSMFLAGCIIGSTMWNSWNSKVYRVYIDTRKHKVFETVILPRVFYFETLSDAIRDVVKKIFI